MALYSDLVLKLQATVSSDGGQVLIEDVTGVYDPENPSLNPGGYAPEGSGGSPERPEESQVSKFLMYRPAPFVQETENIPSEAIAPPHTYSLLTNLGVPAPDTVYQWVFMVTSVDGDTWSYLVSQAFESGDPWGYLVSYFSDDESGNPVQIGQLAVPVTTTSGNCVYDALRRFNNAQMGGSKNCDATEYATKKALLQGVYSNALIAQSLTISSETGDAAYDASQTILDQLNTYCLDESTMCNVC